MSYGRPQLPLHDVPRVASLFNIVADGLQVREVDSYDDLVFVLTTALGDGYVMHVYNTARTENMQRQVECQVRVMARLREHALPVPMVIKSTSGEALVTLDSPVSGASRLLVSMFTYLEGELMPAECAKTDALLQHVGEIAGCVSHALVDYEEPDLDYTSDWDMRVLPKVIRSKLAFIPDAERACAARLADEYQAGVCDMLAKLPHSVLHADLNDTNLLFKEGRVVGIIDFGDAVLGCSLFEPGITAAYFSLCQPNPMVVFREVLRGYVRRAEVTLSDLEIAAYFHIARGRLLLSVVNSAHGCSLEPDNSYLAHTAEPGWAALRLLAPISEADAVQYLSVIFTRNEVE